MSVRYTGFLKSHSESIVVDAQKVLEDPTYEIPSKSKCSDVVRQIENYVTLKYDSEDVPDVELLMNMFEKLNSTYTGSKDNFVKQMHVNIIKHFKVFVKKENLTKLNAYLKACETRYHLDPKDFS